MELIEVGCNTNGNSDGIGKHAYIVNEELNTFNDVNSKLFTGITSNKRKVEKIFSIQMSKTLLEVAEFINNKKIDCVIVEYPFDEYNPLIILAYSILKKSCIKNKTNLALSLHEYDRVKKLRKIVINYLAKKSNLLFVSEPRYLSKLLFLNSKIFLRTIPNHIPLNNKNGFINKENNKYVYFGLINRSKAFEEMLRAWDMFNVNSENELLILTATKIEFDDKKHKNVRLYYDLSNEEVSKIMNGATFSVVPVRPNIGFNNSSMVSSMQTGCIPIGVFNDDYRNENFVININGCEVEDIYNGLISSKNIEINKVKTMSKNAREFGQMFTLNNTARMMIDAIRGLR